MNKCGQNHRFGRNFDLKMQTAKKNEIFSDNLNQNQRNNRSRLGFKIFIILSFSILYISSYSTCCNAQLVETNTANSTFGEKSIKGFVVCLELDVRTVEKSWQRYLKSFGKFESIEKQKMLGNNLMLSNISGDAVDFYSSLSVSPRCIQLFMGALRAGSGLELPENQQENVRKMLYDFAIEQYRQDLILQISEAERVVNLAVKAHDKRVSDGQNIKSKMAKNRKELQRLYQQIEQNATELKRLKADSAQNVIDQETALEEISKVRRIAEDKKQKLSAVR